MSTIKATNIAHTSASVSNMVLGSNGAVTFGGSVIGSGLDLITTQSFSAASTVSVNNCFTSTYENYRIMFSNVSANTGSPGLFFRFRVSGSDDSSSVYSSQYTSISGTTVSTSRGLLSYANVGDAYTDPMCMTMDIFNPYLIRQTMVVSNNAINVTSGTVSIRYSNFLFSSTTIFDGFTFYPQSNTISGTIRVYGYKN